MWISLCLRHTLKDMPWYTEGHAVICWLSDIDECLQHAGMCRNGTCENTLGSYHCKCHKGFELTSRGDCFGQFTIAILLSEFWPIFNIGLFNARWFSLQMLMSVELSQVCVGMAGVVIPLVASNACVNLDIDWMKLKTAVLVSTEGALSSSEGSFSIIQGASNISVSILYAVGSMLFLIGSINMSFGKMQLFKD